jgi:hypothetical protein
MVSFVRERFNYRPAEEVFASAVFHKSKKADTSDILADLTSKVEELLGRMDSCSANTTVYDVIDEMAIAPDVKRLLEMYLGNAGIYRQEVAISV